MTINRVSHDMMIINRVLHDMIHSFRLRYQAHCCNNQRPEQQDVCSYHPQTCYWYQTLRYPPVSPLHRTVQRAKSPTATIDHSDNHCAVIALSNVSAGTTLLEPTLYPTFDGAVALSTNVR